MDFHKRIISVVLVIILVGAGLFAARGGIREINPEDEESAWFDRSDTIYFWYSDDSLTDYVTKAAVDFGEANNVHVFPMLITMDNYLEGINRASITNDQMPDAYILKHEDLEMACMAGLAVPISDDAGICTTEYFAQTALDSVTYKGNLVGYPMSYNTCVLVYNEDLLRVWSEQKALAILTGEGSKYADKDYFAEISDELQKKLAEEYGEAFYEEEVISPDEYVVPEKDDSIYEIDSELVPYAELSEEEKVTVLTAKTEDVFETALPETLNDLLTIADTFDAPVGVEGVMKWDVSDIFFNYWIAGDAITLGGPSGDDKNDIVLKTPESVTYLNYYKHLHQFFALETIDADYGRCLQDFIDGKMMFSIVSVDAVAKLRDAERSGDITFRYGFTTLPAVDEVTLSRPMSMTNVVAVNGYSEKKELANAFASYLVNECAADLYVRTGRPACNMNAGKGNVGLEAFDRSYAVSDPLPKIIELENIWMELEALFARIWSGEDVETELQALESTVKLFFN